MTGIDTVVVIPNIALTNDGDLKSIASIQVYINVEGIELTFHGLQEVVILGPDFTPSIIRIASQRTCQHPGALIHNARLPRYKNGSIFRNRLSNIKLNFQSRGRVVAFDNIAFLCQFGHCHRFSVSNFHFLQHSRSIALIERDLPIRCGRIGCVAAAAGKNHGQNQQASKQHSCQ